MNVNRKIDQLVNSGLTRLEAIASLNLGQRSEAAKRVIIKRQARLNMGSVKKKQASQIVKLKKTTEADPRPSSGPKPTVKVGKRCTVYLHRKRYSS